MPTLNWIGKDSVVKHHNDVPFRTLDKQYTFSSVGSEQSADIKSDNKIIHGDNLEALKALLPEYEGRIKCIYIDPPYNTGNENWVYNDNVNSPKIQKWLGQVVGKEAEDLSRHDKWLCMMYPRLSLLRQLLSDDGAIFISIDDNEQANLKLICDEIFGAGNLVANIIWEKKYTISNDAKWLSDNHDFIVLYAKNKELWRPNLLPRTPEMDAAYKNPDNHPKGVWKSTPLHAKSGSEKTANFSYVFKNGVVFIPPKGTYPRYSEESLREMEENNEIWFGKDGDSVPSRKTFLCDLKKQGIPSKTLWRFNEVGHNHEAREEIKTIFGGSALFDTPKPTHLINRILQIASAPDSIILDSFAGSGTTAHAVLNLNKQDGGNRKFILVEMEDYAESITAERVRRVINGYGDGKNAVEGTGGSFSYYELGEPIMIGDYINENQPVEKIKEYIWYSETHVPYCGDEDDKYYLGNHNGAGYYFYYEKGRITTLSYDTLDIVEKRAEQYIIYADQCLIDKEDLLAKSIVFKKIPRDIRKF